MKAKLNKKTIFVTVIILFFIYTIFVYQIKDTTTINNLATEVYQNSGLKEPMPTKKFTSDGCSMWFDSAWVECCVEHDLQYWKGGTKKERKGADLTFKECLQDKEYKILSYIMYVAVRLGGHPLIPVPFRWGFGWDYPRYYS